MTKVELENKLVTEIHYLPIKAIETMLKLALLIKKANYLEPVEQTDNFAEFIRISPLMDVDIDLKK